MSLLNEILNEGAAGGVGVTSAGSIAGFRSFIGDKKRTKKTPMKRRHLYGFKVIGESQDGSQFDPNEVISKLKNDTRSAKHEESIAFALEDETGNLVKVWVPKDQGEDFEQALQSALTPNENNPEDGDMEIAEIIFKLKDDFDIIDVNWDEIEEDEEENVESGAEGSGDVEGLDPSGKDGDVEGLDPNEEDMTAGDDDALNQDSGGDATTALQQVIDMMKSDADAKKAEADAKTAEAKAKQAQHAVDLANIKMQGEEEVLDMEDYYGKQKSDREEADKLIKMARYRHDTARDAGKALSKGGKMSTFESRLDLGSRVKNALHKSTGRPIEEMDADVERDPSGAIVDDAEALANFKMQRKKMGAMGMDKFSKQKLAQKRRSVSNIEDPEDKVDQQNILRLDMQRSKIVDKMRKREATNDIGA